MKITCPECSERFDVSNEMVGKKAKCGGCSHVFVVPEPKSKRHIEIEEEVVDTRETAWLSLYLAGIAVLLLLFRAQQGALIATMLFALAIESAAIFFTWRGFSAVWPYKNAVEHRFLLKTAILVNGIVLGLLALSLLLTLYAIIAGSGSGGLGGLGGGADGILKYFQELQKNMPK